jgi:serine/threonine-protein kinase
VHRDLKPSNLFLVERRDGRELVKVLDFGISKLTRSLDDSSSLLGPTATADSTIMGSIAYMSPEQLESSSRADERSDVWSLGVVLYELVSGSRPFEGENAVAVAARIAGSPPRPLRTIREDVPAALDQVVAKCLSKDPAERFATVTDLVAALRAVAGEEIPTVRRRASVAYAALVGLGLAGLGAYLLPRPPPASPSPERVPAASIVSTLSSARAVEEPPPPTRSAAVEEPSPPPPKVPALVAPTKEPAPLPRAPAASARSSAVAPSQPASPPRQVDLRDPALEGR